MVELTFQVYVSRLFFELIADPSYGQLLSGLTRPCRPYTPTAPPKARSPRMFTTHVSKRATENAA